MSDADFREAIRNFTGRNTGDLFRWRFGAVNPSGEEFGPTRLYEVSRETSTGQPAVFATVSNPR